MTSCHVHVPEARWWTITHRIILWDMIWYEVWYSGLGKTTAVTLTVVSFMQCTLPLINAAVFPLIVILRKPSLREKYKGFILSVLKLPIRLVGKVRVVCRQREGYEVLD